MSSIGLAGRTSSADHVRVAAVAVAVDDQQIAVEDGRAAVAVLRFVVEPRLPHDLAGRRQRRRALRAEVHVDPVAVDDRRRRRVAVLGVDRFRAVDAEDLRVHDLAPGGDVEGQRAERHARRRPSRAFDAVVSQTRPPATTGDDQPRPARAPSRRRSSTRSIRAAGRSRACPWPDGPRNQRVGYVPTSPRHNLPEHHAGEIFDVYLVNDTGGGGHDAEPAKGFWPQRRRRSARGSG